MLTSESPPCALRTPSFDYSDITNGEGYPSFRVLLYFTIDNSPLQKLTRFSVHKMAKTWLFNNAVPMITSTKSRVAMIHLTRYSMFANRTVNHTLCPRSSDRPRGSTELRMMLKPAPVSKTNLDVLMEVGVSPIEPLTQ